MELDIIILWEVLDMNQLLLFQFNLILKYMSYYGTHCLSLQTIKVVMKLIVMFGCYTFDNAEQFKK
jgi:hypothetical protein